MRNFGFVIGNGTSRQGLDFDSLHSKGLVYGCNALYRDVIPDYLVAVDAKMVLEITNNNIQNKCSVWTNEHNSFKNLRNINFFKKSKGWSSGPTALDLAVQNDHKEIHIFGFDYSGIGENNNKVNNVYAGTWNYKKENEKATYYGNWLRQTVSVIHNNKHIKFLRVIGENAFIPSEMLKLNNLIHINYDEYYRYLKNA